MKKIILATVAAAVSTAATWSWWPRSVPTSLRLPGTVESQEVRLGSRSGGRVAAVEVREGQVVEPGQTLVRLEADELTARRNQAKSRLDMARAAWEKAYRGPLEEEVAEAKAAADAARARLARIAAGSREEQIRHAKHELEAEQADLTKAERDYKRVMVLSAVSALERDATTAARDRARGRVDAARATHDLMTQGSRAEDVAEAEAERDRYVAKHALLVKGTRQEDTTAAYAAVAEAEAKLAETEVALREAIVVAPERCVVEVVSVRAGDLVPPGHPVVRVLRADDLWAKVFVPATELGKVKLGRAVEVSIDSHPGLRFHGVVTQIASVSEFTPRNVQSIDERRHQVFAVKVCVTNPDGVFKSGMAAEVLLDVSEDH